MNVPIEFVKCHWPKVLEVFQQHGGGLKDVANVSYLYEESGELTGHFDETWNEVRFATSGFSGSFGRPEEQERFKNDAEAAAYAERLLGAEPKLMRRVDSISQEES